MASRRVFANLCGLFFLFWHHLFTLVGNDGVDQLMKFNQALLVRMNVLLADVFAPAVVAGPFLTIHSPHATLQDFSPEDNPRQADGIVLSKVRETQAIWGWWVGGLGGGARAHARVVCPCGTTFILPFSVLECFLRFTRTHKHAHNARNTHTRARTLNTHTHAHAHAHTRTQMDTVDDKVGAAISMVYVSGAPIVFVGVGQNYGDLRKMSVRAVVKALLKK